MRRKFFYLLTIFTFVFFSFFWYSYGGKYIQYINPKAWVDIRAKVMSDCLMVDKLNNDVISDITKRISRASTKYVTERSGNIKLFLMYDSNSQDNFMRCRVGWLGDLDFGKAYAFYVNNNNEVVRLYVRSPMK